MLYWALNVFGLHLTFFGLNKFKFNTLVVVIKTWNSTIKIAIRKWKLILHIGRVWVEAKLCEAFYATDTYQPNKAEGTVGSSNRRDGGPSGQSQECRVVTITHTFAALRINTSKKLWAQRQWAFWTQHTAMGAQQKKQLVTVGLVIFTVFISGVGAWTGEIHGRVVCDVCGDSAVGPEDHVLEGPFFISLLKSAH